MVLILKMILPNYLIPQNDLQLRPEKIYKVLEELFDDEIDKEEEYIIILSKLKTNILNNFKKRYLWQTEFLSEKVCEHVYGDKSKKFGQICNSRIDLLYDGKNYKCSRHIGKEHTPKKHVIKEEERCTGFNKYNEPCNKKRLNN